MEVVVARDYTRIFYYAVSYSSKGLVASVGLSLLTVYMGRSGAKSPEVSGNRLWTKMRITASNNCVVLLRRESLSSEIQLSNGRCTLEKVNYRA